MTRHTVWAGAVSLFLFSVFPAVSSADDLPVATLDEIDGLDRQARQQTTAREADALYDRFLRTHSVPETYQKKFSKRRKQWEDRARKNLVRLGRQWVTEEKREQAAREAQQMIRDALGLLRNNDKEGAHKMLLKASRTNPNAIVADYLLGLFNSGRFLRFSHSHPEMAIRHFRVVLTRSPRHHGAMNNLAVAYFKEKEVSRAIRYWREAREISPNDPFVKHNIRRALREAVQGTVSVRRKHLTDLREMAAAYGELAPIEESPRAWAIVPLVVPDAERPDRMEQPEGEEQRQDNRTSRTKVPTFGGSGTGFVISERHILTNRHVVWEQAFGTADEVEVHFPHAERRPIRADIVSISQEHDLALLECDGLDVRPLKLTTAKPRLGLEVMALGFPAVTNIRETRLTATRGSISALPTESESTLIYDVALNPGNSGGPLLGQDGLVVAVNTFGYVPSGQVLQPLSGGVPAANAIEFVSENLPGFTGSPEAPVIPWEQIAETSAPPTVLVKVAYFDRTPAMVHGDDTPQAAECFLDQSCAHCKGWGKTACPNPRCSGGGVLSYRTYSRIVASSRLGTVVRNGKQSFRTRCPTCNGRNAVDCRFCGGSGRAR